MYHSFSSAQTHTCTFSLSLSLFYSYTHTHNSGVWYPLNDSQVGLIWLTPVLLSLSASLAAWGRGKRRLSNVHTSRLPNWVSAHPISAQGPRSDEWQRCLASYFRSTLSFTSWAGQAHGMKERQIKEKHRSKVASALTVSAQAGLSLYCIYDLLTDMHSINWKNLQKCFEKLF